LKYTKAELERYYSLPTGYFKILEHKGVPVGMEVPDWVRMSLVSPRDIEKLPVSKGNACMVMVTASGPTLDEVRKAAQVRDNEAKDILAAGLASRFADALARRGWQKDEDLEERVASMSFPGLVLVSEWWVCLGYYKDQKMKTLDRTEYRMIRLCSIDRAELLRQLGPFLPKGESESSKRAFFASF